MAKLLSDDAELPERCSFAKHVTERGKDERRKEGASAWPRSRWYRRGPRADSSHIAAYSDLYYNTKQTFNIPDHAAHLTRRVEEAVYGDAECRQEPGTAVGGGRGRDKDPRKV